MGTLRQSAMAGHRFVTGGAFVLRYVCRQLLSGAYGAQRGNRHRHGRSLYALRSPSGITSPFRGRSLSDLSGLLRCSCRLSSLSGRTDWKIQLGQRALASVTPKPQGASQSSRSGTLNEQSQVRGQSFWPTHCVRTCFVRPVFIA